MPTLRALLAALVVPILGVAVMIYVLSDPDAQNGSRLADVAACIPQHFSLSVLPQCAALQTHYNFLLLSLATTAAGLAIIVSFALASWISGSNRVLLSVVFPGLSFVGLVLVAAIVTAQIIIIAGAAYFAEQYWFGHVHIAVLLTFVVAGILFGLAILWRTLQMFRPAVSGVVGVKVSPVEHPRLAQFVKHIADQTGASMPDNLLLGFDPNFFATTAPVRTPFSEELLTGQTMFLSVPLMRVLSLEEMRAVVGHEMAHFTGADTIYSKQFAPIYRGIAEAAQVADEDKPYDRNPLLLPARLFLRFMMDRFAGNAAAVSRKRELRADEIGAQVASPEDLGYALVKVGILSMIWQRELQDTERDISRGRFRRNMSRAFEEKLKFDVDPGKLPALVAFSLSQRAPHPTDSHPTTEERISRLNLNALELASAQHVMARFFAQAPARLALDNMEHVEETLTQVYHQLIIGPSPPPQIERSDDEVFVAFLIAFLAHMVAIDGDVDDREIAVAEQEATSRVQNFDQREFRDCCHHIDQIAPIEKLTEWSVHYLSKAGFELLLDMLHKIAAADGALHEHEEKLLQTVRALYEEIADDEPAAAPES